MTRHLPSLRAIVSWGILSIAADLASAEKEPASMYFKPHFPHYFKSVSTFYNQPNVSPYQSQLTPSAYESTSSMEISREGRSPFRYFYTWLKACPLRRILTPCYCTVTPGLVEFRVGHIVCPTLTAADTLDIFSRIPGGLFIESVTLNLRRGTNRGNSMPSSFLANYPDVTISIAVPNDNSCIDSSLLSPCTCVDGTINCPSGTAIAQLNTIFNRIAANTNLGNLILNLATGEVPAQFLGINAANTIKLIGSLSQLSIDARAFTASAAQATALTIEGFDLKNLDYSFLAGFNVLKNILINRCTNTPTVGFPPKNLPTLPSLISIRIDGVIYTNPCSNAALLDPCTCDAPAGAKTASITCPVGTTLAKIQNAFKTLPANSNIGNVVLNLPAGRNIIPANLLGSIGAETIELIGSAIKSKLTIDMNAFASSASKARLFTIQAFDLEILDFSFLKGFKVLTNIFINQCINTPTIGIPPKNLPTLPSLISILIDGSIYTNPCFNAALLAPCTCWVPAGAKIASITCPAGTTIAKIQNAFKTLPSDANIGNVVLNIPHGEKILPANLLGDIAADTIELIGPVIGNSLLKLTIDKDAFESSASKARIFIIQAFDLGLLDYSFLKGFHLLSNIFIKQCINTPTIGFHPKNLPTLQSLISIIIDGVIYNDHCSNTGLLAPCSCSDTAGATSISITCPTGTTIAQIQNAFNILPANTKIGKVVLNLPAGDISIPANLIGRITADTISLIGSPGSTLSRLTIDVKAFKESAARTTQFTIQQFDLVDLDYSFLTGFDDLTKILLNQCSNTPFAANPPRNLPTFLKLVSLLVDGVDYNAACPTVALIAPCSCTVPAGDPIITMTCPAGNTIAQIQAAFKNLPANSNIGNLILYLPDGAHLIPSNILGSSIASTIKLIGPISNMLSKLRIESGAFRASTAVATLFTIEQFDLVHIDFSFLTGFNVLTKVLLNQCSNTPFAGNPPKNLPTLPKLTSVFVDGVNYISACPTAALLAPCTCIVPAGDPAITVTCPAGSTITQIQAAFQNLPATVNVGNIILNLPAGANLIPSNILGSSTASTIKLIGPASNILSQLTIEADAFRASAAAAKLFTIEQFDLVNLDYCFLDGFNVLTKVLLNHCLNTPFAANPPKNLPTLPKLVSVFVDGVNYNAACPTAALIAPCSCIVPAGDSVVTITCPAGNTIAKIQAAFNNLPVNANIGNIILNLPAGATLIPSNILGSCIPSTIKLIGSDSSILSKLTINSAAFASSLAKVSLITIEQFDLVNLDYSFLTGFNVLTKVLLNQCSNTPFAGNPPKNLPTLPKLTSVFVDGVNFISACPTAALLAPCTCIVPAGDPAITVTCPAGSTITQIQAAFQNLPATVNVGNIILNLPAGAILIPSNILGSSIASTIKLIGPASNILSQLTIKEDAFRASAAAAKLFTIEQFDLVNLDYCFLDGFNVLTKVLLNHCLNTPFAANPPKNLPTLPKLVSVFVDGVNYNATCPTAALIAPCSCIVPAGDSVVTITCPAGNTIAQIQAAFNNLPEHSYIGNIILNLSVGVSTYIPASILGTNSATSIKVIGPAVNSGDPLSRLTIDPRAFTSSAKIATEFWIANFDVANVDYSFLTFFNALKTVAIKKCSNFPSKISQLKNLPTNLPSLASVFVDETNILTQNGSGERI